MKDKNRVLGKGNIFKGFGVRGSKVYVLEERGYFFRR